MLNDDNSTIFIEEYMPLQSEIISHKGSFACRRAIGEGYYDEERHRTCIAWNEEGMRIYIAYFDYKEKKWSKPECVYECNLYGRWDYHDYVTMVPDKNGNPLIIYHIHSKLAYIVKKNNMDQWKRRMFSQDQNAYPAPIRYKDCIYLFYSQNKEISYPYRPLRFMKSLDDGESWSEPKDVIDSKKKTPDKVDEVYQSNVVFTPAGHGFPDRLLITYTMWGGKQHAYCGKGAYCVAFYPEDEKCYDLEGTYLGEVVDYEIMVKYCEVDPGRISPLEEYSHVTYGPLVSVDGNNTPIVVYGHRDEMRRGLYMAVKKNGLWEKKLITDKMWNVKDAERIGEGIELAVCCEGSAVIFRKEDTEENFTIKSVTNIPHKNNSNSVTYFNFITGGQQKAKLLMGLIDEPDIDGYYNGKWPVVVFSENGGL